MAKIIDFVAEALQRGNTLPFNLLAEQVVARPHKTSRFDNKIDTHNPMHELSDVHRLAGFRSRRELFWHLSDMYHMDVDLIQHWALELGTENDFTLLIERIHEVWDPNL